ncbi:MAG TPA: biotin/lipoyl-containing protein [Patescibacteria group bacterium]|nr:biotin/lipoyl-containing protein [Patescibacteria group bacterium]
MRWTARLGDQVHEVELTRGPGGLVTAAVDGRSYTLSVTEPQSLVYSLLCEDGASYEAIVGIKQGRCRVRLGSRVFDVTTGQPARFDLKGAAGAGTNADGGKLSVRAVMPGRVLRVMVKAGETVAARQGLVVVEAMKMENEIAAPRDGVVREVKVAAGSTVENGELLLVIE